MNAHRQHGVTIVEALVALVILSVGMLGIASLYVTSLKTGRTALTRTHAVNLVNDIMDSIRANGAAVEGYETGTRELVTATKECAGVELCTRDELAEYDLVNWKRELEGNLPAGRGVIDVTPGTPDRYVVTVNWREPGEDDDYSYSSTLEMLPVTP
jgi:type IV pilus assembly protein PilV